MKTYFLYQHRATISNDTRRTAAMGEYILVQITARAAKFLRGQGIPFVSFVVLHLTNHAEFKESGLSTPLLNKPLHIPAALCSHLIRAVRAAFPSLHTV